MNKKPKDALQLYLCLTSPLYMLITVHVNSWPDVGLYSKGFSVAGAANIRILFKKWLYGVLKVSHLNTWIGNFLTLAETQLALSHQIPWQSITLTSGGWREDNLVQGQTQFWPWMEGCNDHIWCCRMTWSRGTHVGDGQWGALRRLEPAFLMNPFIGCKQTFALFITTPMCVGISHLLL